MDPNYKPIYVQAQRLEYRIKDVADDHSDSVVKSLKRDARSLLDDMESSKKPRSVEARVKTMQGLLERIRAQGDRAMDYHHVDELHGSLENMCRSLRKLPNY